MTQTVLLAGCPASSNNIFLDAAQAAGNKVFSAITTDTANPASQENMGISWNRASPISSRALILQAENAFDKIGQAVLFFDTTVYNSYFSNYTLESVSRGIDEMLLGYLYLTNELLPRLSQAEEGQLVFYVYEPAQAENSVLVTAAQAAFCAFAEKIAGQYAGKNLGVTLVKSETEASAENASWLFNYLQLPQARKVQSSPKHAAHWLKPGAKPAVLLPFLAR